MSQTVFLPAPCLPTYQPHSPDPTPLRLLAFSVAEAALQQDPNSPSLADPSSREHNKQIWGTGADWSGSWGAAAEVQTKKKPLWDVVQRAKERRGLEKAASPAYSTVSLASSPPASPSSYNFALPPSSFLAASIAAKSDSYRDLPRLTLSPTTSGRPLYTRSAEPSPTKSTFSTLDQSRPPPEFVPRLSSSEPSNASHVQPGAGNGTHHTRAKSDMFNTQPRSDKMKSDSKLPYTLVPSRHTARLPSLQQIQAKLNQANAAHRRSTSVGATVPSAHPRHINLKDLPPPPQLTRLRLVSRTSSAESVEILKTPTDENLPIISSSSTSKAGRKHVEPRVVLNTALLNRRPTSPPSPITKESKLAPFLRERTSGRLAGSTSRPASTPPSSIRKTEQAGNILLKFTPPTLVSTVPPPLISPTAVRSYTTPTRTQFFSHSNRSLLSTPPHKRPTSPASPTGSVRSFSSTTSLASPTLSVPIITCTPAPVRIVKEGVEQDSDEEEGDVIVFDGQEAEEEDKERVRMGKFMKDRLLMRRRSSD